MSDKKYYEDYWNLQVEGSHVSSPPEWSDESLKWHLDYFKPYIGMHVLAAGGGEGIFLNYLNQNISLESAVSVDISEAATEIGMKKHPDIDFRTGTIEQLSKVVEPASFDTVFAVEVVEHILDIDTALDEIYKVLKPGGYFCVTTTDFNLPKQLIIGLFFWNKFFFPNTPHIRFFTGKTLKKICETHNLERVSYKWNKSYFKIMPHGQMAVFKKIS